MTDANEVTATRHYRWFLVLALLFLLIAACLPFWIRYQRQIVVIDRIRATGGDLHTRPTDRPEWLDNVLGQRWSQGFGDGVYINVSGLPVSDDLLKDLSALPDLEFLELSETQITDAGLAHLKGLTKLRWLDLENTKVTDAGVKDLQAALPEWCSITR